MPDYFFVLVPFGLAIVWVVVMAFMEPDTFEQVHIPSDLVDDLKARAKELEGEVND